MKAKKAKKAMSVGYSSTGTPLTGQHFLRTQLLSRLMLGTLLLFSVRSFAGGISSGTPPIRVEASCRSENDSIKLSVDRPVGGAPYATIQSPWGNAQYSPLTFAPESGTGTPAETPRIFAGAKFRLDIWITHLPVGPNPNIRRGQVFAVINNQIIQTSVVCELYL